MSEKIGSGGRSPRIIRFMAAVFPCPQNGGAPVRTCDWFKTLTRLQSKEAHFVDCHRHRIYVRLFRRAVPAKSELSPIKQLRRTPTRGSDTCGFLSRCRMLQITFEHHMSEICEASATILGDEDIGLHQVECLYFI